MRYGILTSETALNSARSFAVSSYPDSASRTVYRGLCCHAKVLYHKLTLPSILAEILTDPALDDEKRLGEILLDETRSRAR